MHVASISLNCSALSLTTGVGPLTQAGRLTTQVDKVVRPRLSAFTPHPRMQGIICEVIPKKRMPPSLPLALNILSEMQKTVLAEHPCRFDRDVVLRRHQKNPLPLHDLVLAVYRADPRYWRTFLWGLHQQVRSPAGQQRLLSCLEAHPEIKEHVHWVSLLFESLDWTSASLLLAEYEAVEHGFAPQQTHMMMAWLTLSEERRRGLAWTMWNTAVFSEIRADDPMQHLLAGLGLLYLLATPRGSSSEELLQRHHFLLSREDGDCSVIPIEMYYKWSYRLHELPAAECIHEFLKKVHLLSGGEIKETQRKVELQSVDPMGLVQTKQWLSFLISSVEAFFQEEVHLKSEEQAACLERLYAICASRLHGVQVLHELMASQCPSLKQALAGCPEVQKRYEERVSWIAFADQATSAREVFDEYLKRFYAGTPAGEAPSVAFLLTVGDLCAHRGEDWGEQVLAMGILIGLNPVTGILHPSSLLDHQATHDLRVLLSLARRKIWERLSEKMPFMLAVRHVNTADQVDWPLFLLEQMILLTMTSEALPPGLDWGTRLRNICLRNGLASTLEEACQLYPALEEACRRSRGNYTVGGAPLAEAR